MMILYQFEVSPFCEKVRRILNFKGLDYETRELGITSRRIKRLNPEGKVPILEVHGRHIADSSRIAVYLEKVCPQPALFPEDPRKQAMARLLEDWADESLYFYELTMRFVWPQNAAGMVRELFKEESKWKRGIAEKLAPRQIGRIAKAQGAGRKSQEQLLRDLGMHIEDLEQILGSGPYLLGDALTIADIGVFSQLKMIGQTPEGAEVMAASEAIGSWLERVDGATSPSEEQNILVGVDIPEEADEEDDALGLGVGTP